MPSGTPNAPLNLHKVVQVCAADPEGSGVVSGVRLRSLEELLRESGRSGHYRKRQKLK